MKLFLLSLISLLSSAAATMIQNCTTPGWFAITYDEGPSILETGILLNILAPLDLPINFHLSTEYFSDPTVLALAMQVKEQGHLVGLRFPPSMDNFTLTNDQIVGNVTLAANVFTTALGFEPTFLRLPYMTFSPTVWGPLENLGYILTEDNLDSYDYLTNDILANLNSTLLASNVTEDSFIFILRDYIAVSVTEALAIIDMVQANGYTLVYLDKCVGNYTVLGTNPDQGKYPAVTSTTVSFVSSFSASTSSTTASVTTTSSTSTSGSTTKSTTVPPVNNAAPLAFSVEALYTLFIGIAALILLAL